MSNNDSRALSVGAIAIAIISFFVVGALVVTRDDNSAAAPAAALETVTVTLADMKITPAELHIPPAGATLVIHNDGPSAHTLTIDGLGVATEEIAAGDE